MRASHRWLTAAGVGAGLSLMWLGRAKSKPYQTRKLPEHGHLPFSGLAESLFEEHDYQARLEGELPRGLQGTYYRNGPGLFERGGRRKRHLLDGDGMVQAFQLFQGRVHYRNRFVRTERFIKESEAGRYRFASWTTQRPGGALLNLLGGRMRSNAGVTVIVRNGMLHAFDDGGEPYAMEPSSLETLGRSDLGLPEKLYRGMLAHSRVDASTGEWTCVSRAGAEYAVATFAPHGGLRHLSYVPVPWNIYVHDFLATRRFVLFIFHPMQVSVAKWMLGQRSYQDALSWHPEAGNLVVVADKEGKRPPLRLCAKSTFMWHGLNAFEEDGRLVADFVGYDNPDHFVGADPMLEAVMRGRRGQARFPGKVRRYTIDLDRPSLDEEVLSHNNHEFPIVNPAVSCRPHRYGYFATSRHAESSLPSGITRLDTHLGREVGFQFGGSVYCSEPVFAPVPGMSYAPHDEREPGWLLTECYDGATHRSFLAVFDAERVGDGPLCRAHLQHHAPYSFHGYWSAAA